MEPNSNKRILKNTLSLYFRTAILTIVTLFTSRVVLQVLGVDDYGINNVVAGFVSMFAFISGTLSNATQRYFAIDLAQSDWERLNKTYSINLAIYIFFIVIIFVISETLGLWFVMNKLNFDVSRMTAAVVVYECSIVLFLITLFVSPYIALLTADENLSIYSAVSVVEAVLKLAVAYILLIIDADKLIAYSVFTTIASTGINLFYYYYAKRKYNKLRFTLCKDLTKYKDVFSFQGWNLIGAVATVLKGQGINIIINLFFGTTLNAARAIALQVNSAINSFASNFMRAVDPQITKAYGARDDNRFNLLIFSASKMAFALLFILSVPVIFDVKYILNLWLGNVPDYTVTFVRLALIDAILYSFTDAIGTAVQSVGKIKVYQMVVGGTLILNVPLSYLGLKIYTTPLIPFYVAIILSALGSIGRIICLRRIYSFKVLEYIKQVLIPIFLVTIILIVIVDKILVPATNLLQLIYNVVICVGLCGSLIVTIVLNEAERKILREFIVKKIGRTR